LKIDGFDVTSYTTIADDGIQFVTSIKLEDGNHTVYLEVCDNSSNPNKANVTWSFTVDTSEGEEPPPAEKDFLSEYWWLLVVIAAVIIILVVMFLILNKKRRTDALDKSKEKEKTTQESKTENSGGKE
jgi:hypothetical protein